MNPILEKLICEDEDKFYRRLLKPSTDFKETIYLKHISCEDHKLTEDDRLKAEVLINYINKLNRAKYLVSFYEDAVNALMQELPTRLIMEADNEVTYFIAKKPFDRYFYTTEKCHKPTCCCETPCKEEQNDR